MRLHHRLVDVRVLADDGHELGFAVLLQPAYVGEMLPVVCILAAHPVILVAGGVAHTGPAEQLPQVAHQLGSVLGVTRVGIDQ